MTGIADALSAASLLLAALALVYGAWSGSIDQEANRTYAPNATAKANQKKETRKIRSHKALPLAAGSWLIFLAFLPRGVEIIKITLGCDRHRCVYSDVSAIFVLAEIFVVGLAIHLSERVHALNMKLKD